MGRLAGHFLLSTDGVAKTWSVAAPKTDDDMMIDDARKRTHALLQTATTQASINNAQWSYRTIILAA